MEILIGLTMLYLLFVGYNKITAPKVNQVNGRQLSEMLEDKKAKRQYIDVRTTGEFNSRKIKGFKNIPLDQLTKRKSEIDPEMEVVVMCASGSRSMRAVKMLNKMGYKNLTNVKGGISSVQL
ncbi:MAG: hypothetical protein BGO41_12505 [Clostridiales bacterium 38-18]|nr:MAG: hypothetical protein BGO41_12505 [Clostridiales bacterium 38-18]